MRVCVYMCVYISTYIHTHIPNQDIIHTYLIPYWYIRAFYLYLHTYIQISTSIQICMYVQRGMGVQPIPLGVTFSKALSKLKAQSSNVSFHWKMAKETFEFWALSFRKCHPKWDWLYLYLDKVCVYVYIHTCIICTYILTSFLIEICMYIYICRMHVHIHTYSYVHTTSPI